MTTTTNNAPDSDAGRPGQALLSQARVDQIARSSSSFGDEQGRIRRAIMQAMDEAACPKCSVALPEGAEPPHYNEVREIPEMRNLAVMATEHPCFTNSMVAVVNAYQAGWQASHRELGKAKIRAGRAERSPLPSAAQSDLHEAFVCAIGRLCAGATRGQAEEMVEGYIREFKEGKTWPK